MTLPVSRFRSFASQCTRLRDTSSGRIQPTTFVPVAKASFAVDSYIVNPDRYMNTVGSFDYTGETIFNADDFGNGFRLRAEKDIFTRVQLH